MHARKIQIPLLFLLMSECFVCGVCRSSTSTEEVLTHVLLLLTECKPLENSLDMKVPPTKVFPFNQEAICYLLA